MSCIPGSQSDASIGAPPTSPDSLPSQPSPSRPCAPGPWRDLSILDRLAIFLMMATVALAGIPRLPTGICHADSGGFQLAAATLGITHPPGYAGYVSLWHLLTRIFGGDPAYVVAVSCLVAGLGVLALVTLFQFRLGVNIWIASAVSLALAMHTRVWANLLVPEIYMISLLFLAASLYLILRYAALGRACDLWAAAFMYGIAVANRLPSILLLPFILYAFYLAQRRWETRFVPGLRRLTFCALLAALPGAYNLAYLWILDTPDATYNYLEQYNAVTPVLPLSTDGWGAKWRRVTWHQSGEQFRYLLLWYRGNDFGPSDLPYYLGHCAAKMRWVVQDLLPDATVSFRILWVLLCVTTVVIHRRWRRIAVALAALSVTAALLFGWAHLSPQLFESHLAQQLVSYKYVADIVVVAALFVAMVTAARRSVIAGVLLAGLVFGCLFFISIYRVHGLAGDLLPFLFVVAVLIGVILSTVFPGEASHPRAALAGSIFVMVAVSTVYVAPQRYSMGLFEDAAPYLAQVDMATLPKGTVICASWGESTPLWYARLFLTPRPDITVINAIVMDWPRILRPHLRDPVFVTEDISRLPFWPGARWQKERNMWRLNFNYTSN